MSIWDSLPDARPIAQIWSARIAKTLTDFADRAEVVIPGLDDNIRWKDCRWQARNTIDFPQRGDECLVAIDENNEVWVVVWWPFV
jgi:hypothetical protein